MVPKKLGVKSAKELNGATVCVLPGTTTELNLADYFRANKMQFKPVVIEKLDEVENAFFSGRCDAYTTDRSGLAATRVARAPNPDDYVILPEVISKEPLAPAVRQGDDQWKDVVTWVIYALFGITPEEASIFAGKLSDIGFDYVSVSSGGISPAARPAIAPGYQVPLAAVVKKASGIAVQAVGMIVDPHQAEAIVAEGHADCVALARGFLDDPRWAWHAAAALGADAVYPP